MTITSAQVHIYKSEVIADTPDGGGHMTGSEVIDGDLNNLFDDASRLDRVNGRVSLRKCFGAAITSDRSKYLGAHAIVTRPPADPNVSALILDLDDSADHRSDAQAHVEQYLVASIESTMTLYNNQPASARTLIVYQDTSATLPAVSDVLCLSVEQVGLANYGYQQFVRITSIAQATVSGVDTYGTYYKTALTLGISDALEITFPGADLTRQPLAANKPTKVRKTDQNPAARYYGIVPLATAITAGDTAIKVSTILQPVVPASYAETPLLDQQVGANAGSLVAAGGTYTETFAATSVGGALSVQLLRPSLPGSVVVTATATSSLNNAALAEQGGGVLQRTGGGSATAAAAGTVVSVAGQVALTGLVDVAYTVVVAYSPAVQVADVQNTSGIAITLANRGFNYSKTLIPKPAPGAVVVNFLALGRWYALVDQGDGTLTGGAGIGAGTINYLTGTVNVTLGYQPDVGGTVLFGWGTGVHYAQALSSSDVSIGINGSLSTDAGLIPGSIDISWTVGATTYHATDSAAHGVLAGDGAGLVDYGTGHFSMVPATLVASGTTFNLAASKKGFHTETPSVSTSGGNKNFSAGTVPVVADTLRVTAVYKNALGASFNVVFNVSGSGFSQLTGVGADAAGIVTNTGSLGTVDNTLGNYGIPATLTNGERYYTYDDGTGLWSANLRDVTFDSLTSVTYTDDGGSSTSVSTSFSQSAIALDFSRGLYQTFLGGSLIFTLAGRTYYENGGTLFYRDGGGVEHGAGTFDVGSGLGTLSDWASGSSTLAVLALLAKIGQWKMSAVTWRTAGNPLRSTSFAVTDGTHTATAGTDGTLSGASAYIAGSINIDTGVYSLTFSPAEVPEVVRYNAVALTYLPIDPSILGLNAVRLPLNGLVPVLAPGYDLVILNDKTDTLTNPVVAGSTYSLSRSALASAQVTDANGLKVTTDKYSIDLDAGTITMANPLDLSAYVQPLSVEHRIEDMVLCVDAQLSGDVTISGSIAHDYPATGTYVASAKLYGDLQSAVDTLICQQAWTGLWSDELQGAASTGQYNNVSFPIEVTNDGAATERWRLQFTNANSYVLIGETFGQIDSGSTLSDFAPINPATGQPYFTVRAGGWGSGWAAGNQVRFNTTACAAPVWLLRCTLQGPATDPTDNFRLQFRGDN